MSGDYRYSIIPAGAVTDPNLEGRDLQVLALLGRHTDRLGWCYRSQVRMAEELRCGRSTVQRSLDRLYKAGWVEKRLRSRNALAADPNHPHAAHAYRVKLDGGEIADEAIFIDEDEAPNTSPSPEGVPTGGQGGAHPERAGGAHVCMGTHVNDDSKDESEQERECARAKNEKRTSVTAFLKRWPSAAIDSQEAIKREWANLPDGDLQPAIDGIDRFLAELKKHRRSQCPSGATYLRERKWKGLPPPGQIEVRPKIVSFLVWSREWWAMVFAMADRGESIKFKISYAKEQGKRVVSEMADRMPSADVISALRAVPATGEWVAAWRPWFLARGANLPFWTEAIWVFLPGPEPPDPGRPALRLLDNSPQCSISPDQSPDQSPD